MIYKEVNSAGYINYSVTQKKGYTIKGLTIPPSCHFSIKNLHDLVFSLIKDVFLNSCANGFIQNTKVQHS